ncbi:MULTISPECIES: fatty acyl-CoA reductase [Spongiibacter]|uniref:fatty acyl-CoA reductase n=1 Tax=Spongiibacter TaxID=630749 RepID=UPI000C61C9C6|nr:MULTISPECIES: fatty acyl-CoA reductase [Spongiibacter]MAY38348.1 dehydrogenase [Spongiibacter sp.]|tara:strand:+ start:541 stop:2106 length:1566 start_codon:yes stop_codon:yes gene_type:complete
MREFNSEPSTTVTALRGKRILITGASGFLGKVVLEKLLRSVPDVEAVYLLMRGNRHHRDARSRFEAEVATSSIFDTLRTERGEWFEQFCQQRLHCITGEVTEPRFGLSRAAFNTLAGEVDAVINSAASVNFREELDRALEINTLSLDNIVELCEAAGGVPLIQVSTCYVNGLNRGDMREENVSPAGMDNLPQHARGYYESFGLVESLLEKIEGLKENYEGRALKAQLVELGIRESQTAGWNDTYTFTKWLGEQRLMRALRDYPLTIVRPSIIESTLQEPCPGWIEGVKVADAILLAYARGKVAFFPGKRSGVIDVIPADLVANAVLLSLAEQFREPGPHRIYQCCSGGSNPLTMGQFIDHLMSEAKENHRDYDKLFSDAPSRRFVAVDKRLFTVVASGLRFALIVLSSLLSRFGRRRKLRARRNLDAAMELSAIFSFYAQPSYIFHNDKLMAMYRSLPESDQALFPVDARAIDWQHYIRKVHIAGLNRYALKGSGRVADSRAVAAAGQAIAAQQQTEAEPL